MNAYNIRPTVKTYSALITAYDKAGRWKEALLVLNQMKEDGVEPNGIYYDFDDHFKCLKVLFVSLHLQLLRTVQQFRHVEIVVNGKK